MNIKKIILVLIILLIIILLILSMILLRKINKDIPNEIPIEPIEIDTKIQQVDNKNDFFTIKMCIIKFYEYLAREDLDDNLIIDEETENYINEQEKNRAEAIYSMLDDEYIIYKNINLDNLFQKIERINQSDVFISRMLVSQRNSNTAVYFVNGILQDKKTKQNSDFKLMVKVDMKNETFAVLLQDYVEAYYNNIEIGQEFKITEFEDITNKNYNTFDYQMVNEEEYIYNLFEELKKYLMYNREEAYNKLDSLYSENRFNTYNSFEEYVKNNIKNIVTMQMKQYQINNFDDYTQYVLIDQNGRYYIFNEKAVMDYTVILDTYTIDLPQFIEKYNSSTDAEKVLLNIQKVFEAINDGDYRYVYNKLDPTFRQNNFATETDFENYIKQNFYETNNLGYGNYKTSGDLHIYEISITDKNNESNPIKTKNFIMKLKEGTDFVMSFNVE